MNLTEVINELLRLGCDSSQIDIYGSTPLIMACYNCNQDIALKLLDFNCNLQQINQSGDSAITISYENKLFTVIKKIATQIYLIMNKS